MDPSTQSEGVGEQITAGELLEKVESTNVVVYEDLTPTNLPEAREEFLADDTIITPRFEYGKLDEEKVNANLATLFEVYEQTRETELSQPDRLAVGILTDDRAKANAFLRDTIDYQQASTPEEKEVAAKAHEFSGGELYGKPDEATFKHLLKNELAAIDVESLSPEDREMYDSLVEEVGDLGESDIEPFQPKPETVARFSEMINELYGPFFKHIPEDKDSFTMQEACDIANEIIREEIGEDYTGYRAVIREDATNCSVNHETREIIFPAERSAGNFTREGLKRILVHEFGTHVYRAMVYEEDETTALSHEMPGNEEIDEGIAKCCEQAITGEYSVSGVEHYINIGLAFFKGKNFREVFEIQRKIAYLKGCGRNPKESPEEREARFHKSDKLIFSRTMRCFRGTGELPNCKDLVYYNGAMKVWKYIEENIDDPDLLDHLFLSGKTDITDKDQERLVYEKKVG